MATCHRACVSLSDLSTATFRIVSLLFQIWHNARNVHHTAKPSMAVMFIVSSLHLAYCVFLIFRLQWAKETLRFFSPSCKGNRSWTGFLPRFPLKTLLGVSGSHNMPFTRRRWHDHAGLVFWDPGQADGGQPWHRCPWAVRGQALGTMGVNTTASSNQQVLVRKKRVSNETHFLLRKSERPRGLGSKGRGHGL